MTKVELFFSRRREEFQKVFNDVLYSEDPCEWEDEFEYADNVLQWSIDEYFGDSYYEQDDEFQSELFDLIKIEFSEEVFERYYDENC